MYRVEYNKGTKKWDKKASADTLFSSFDTNRDFLSFVDRKGLGKWYSRELICGANVYKFVASPSPHWKAIARSTEFPKAPIPVHIRFSDTTAEPPTDVDMDFFVE